MQQQKTKELSEEKPASILIPEQKHGSQTGARHEVTALSRVKALELFRSAKKRLLNINSWHDYSGSGSATFRLTDEKGTPVFRDPVGGDLICIDLPGPGPKAGEGYDWVRIEAIDDKSNAVAEEEIFSFRTRPVKKPGSKKKDIAHFYTSDATSTFVIERKGDVVIAAEIGKNEIPNTAASKLTDKIRNTVMASAAMLGVSSLQWKSLMKGLLKND